LMDSKVEDKRFCTEWWQALLDFILPLIASWIEFLICYVCSQIFQIFHPFKVLLSISVPWLRPAFWARDMTMYYVKPLH
jgi:hypothetical protein